MLIAPNFPWHRADSPEEQLALSKEFGLTPKSYVHPKPLIYRDMDGNIVVMPEQEEKEEKEAPIDTEEQSDSQ